MARFASKAAAAGLTALLGSASFLALQNETKIEHEIENTNSLSDAIRRAEDLCQRVKDESGSPGLVVSVSVDGITVFKHGLGYADVENRLPCHSKTVMRVASISKSITMAVVGKLWEEGKLSFDQPVEDYVTKFPKKYVDNEQVTITMRHLVSHLSGIRHYDKKSNQQETETKLLSTDSTKKEEANKKDEFMNKEYHIKDFFSDVSTSLDLFKDDELFHKPGTKFLYTTHGWTLVSAVVESVAKKPFSTYMKSIFHELGLENTCLDLNSPIIYNRAKCYVRNEKGQLENAPFVDNSYKWAGGGFLSTVEDLVQFGNAMLYSHQRDGGFLKRETTQMIWTPVGETQMPWDKDGSYGMGWGVLPDQSNHPFCNSRKFYVSHTGGAVGASSVLLIMPSSPKKTLVSGVVVAIIVNMQGVGLNRTALQIAELFTGDS